MKVNEYLIVYRNIATGMLGTDHIQALNARQAADIVRNDETIEIIDVAKVCKNWK